MEPIIVIDDGKQVVTIEDTSVIAVTIEDTDYTVLEIEDKSVIAIADTNVVVVEVGDSLNGIEVVEIEDTTDISLIEVGTGDISVIEIATEGPGVDLTKYEQQVDVVSDELVYRGDALPGSLESDPVWRIKRITISFDGDTIETLYANDNANFELIWDNRASYTYI